MQSPVDEIKNRLPIADLIGSYITLEKAGANFKARCPFHNEKTPSFFVSPDRGNYYCFGCGAKGDIFTFTESFEGVDFVGALKMLASKTGVELSFEGYKHTSKKERLYKILEAATLFYEKHLEKNKEANEYLKKRGISEDTKKIWRLGFAPYDWSSMFEFMIHKGVTKEEMMAVGLIKEGEKGKCYDRFRGRIMFPLFDSAERVIGFSGRALKDEEGVAKYLNSPETELFKKSNVLYGIHKAKLAMKKSGSAVLVEGQMDLIMCHQSGIENAIATSGTALTGEHLDIIKRFSDEVIITFDGDNAGLKASERVWQLAIEKDLQVRTAFMPKGKDPAEMLLENPRSLDKIFKEAGHLIDVLIERLKNSDEDQVKKAQISAREILPLVRSVPKAMERGRFVSRIADMLKVKDDVVWEDLKKTTKSSISQDIKGKNLLAKKTRYDMIGEQIWALLWYIEAHDRAKYEALHSELQRLLKDDIYTKIKEMLEPRKEDLVFKAEVQWGKVPFEVHAKDLFLNLEIELTKNMLTEIMDKLFVAEKAEDSLAVEECLKTCKELSDKLQVLKSKNRSF